MLGTFALKLVVFWSNLPSLLSMAITGAYYGGSPPDQKNDKTIPVDCKHLTKNATGNSTFQIKTSYISLPSFLNPLRGSIYITWFFQKGSPVPTITTPFLLLRLSELLGRTKEDVFISEIGPEQALFFKLLWCFKLLLVSKLRVWCLAMVTVLDIPNEGDWWVRDRLLPAFPWCGGLWFFVTVPNYSQVKVTDEIVLRCIVVLCSRDDWLGSRLSWLDTSYLNMGVKLVMEKTGASHEALKLEYICGVNALG